MVAAGPLGTVARLICQPHIRIDRFSLKSMVAAGTLGTGARLRSQLSGLVVLAPPLRTASGADSLFVKAESGAPSTEAYRLFMQKGGQPVSAWHDVPLHNADGTLNFICEIPKDTSAKMEVATVGAPTAFATCMPRNLDIRLKTQNPTKSFKKKIQKHTFAMAISGLCLIQ
jgi:hypothetical protein